MLGLFAKKHGNLEEKLIPNNFFLLLIIPGSPMNHVHIAHKKAQTHPFETQQTMKQDSLDHSED